MTLSDETLHEQAAVKHGPGPGRGSISIKRVSKVYDPSGAGVMAVENCSLDVEAGQFVAIVGPSGCGKTTLLNAIAGFDTISSGAIVLDGEVISSGRKQIGPGPDRVVVFQNGALFPWRTMMENIVYGPVRQKRKSREEAERIAGALLKKVGLEGIQDKYPGEVSSGMQRRVEILRALINQPTVMLLDEPFRALDAVAKSIMHRFLLDLFDDNPRTTIFITHDLEEAIFLADKVVVMTTRPARVKAAFEVALPRPRTRGYRAHDLENREQDLLEGPGHAHEDLFRPFLRLALRQAFDR